MKDKTENDIKDHVVSITNKWTGYSVIYPVPFTKEEAEKWVSTQDKTNSVYKIHELI